MSPVNGILSWWDGVELWLSGLGFVLQTIVVMPVVLALAYLIAVVLDALLGSSGIRADDGAFATATKNPDDQKDGHAAITGDVGAGHLWWCW